MSRKFFYITPLFLLLILAPSKAFSAPMSNDSFILDLNSSQQGTQNISKSTKVGQLSIPADATENFIQENGFTARLSYTSETKRLPLTMTISNSSLNFGEVRPGEPLTRTHSITVEPGATPTYQILASENHDLTSETNNHIPNTTCDSGNCTQFIADLWTNPLTYGFGYRCDSIQGSLCGKEFSQDFFKRYANTAAGELPATLASGALPQTGKLVINDKINIPGTQTQEGYQTTIQYILVPNL